MAEQVRADRSASSLPVVLYDADCAFCSALIRRVQGRCVAARVTAVPYQVADLTALRLSPEACAERLHVVDRPRVFRGAAAIARILRAARWPWAAVGLMMGAPGIGWVCERLYDVLARNRHRLPGGSPACEL